MTPNDDNGSQTSQIDPLLKSPEVAARLGIAVTTLRSWRVKNQGPPWLRFSEGRRGKIRYRQSDVEAWLASRPQR